MSQIKCILNYIELRSLFKKGVTGDALFFTSKLKISKRTFFRLKLLLEEHEKMEIVYSRDINKYYLKK